MILGQRGSGLRGLAAVGLALWLGATAAPCATTAFPAGSLIIPMDTDYQDQGMFKAYGLVYELLRNRVPVHWVILPGKADGDADFTASAKDLVTQAVVASHGYRGGPFVIDQAYAAAALPLIQAWQSANPTTAVHQATASFSCDVARTLVAAPRVALLADGSQSIARAYLVAAGIPDSQRNASWPDTSPDVLTPMLVAGPTTTNHGDGGLFSTNGTPAFDAFATIHWAETSAQASPEVVAETRQFLGHPVSFFAQCESALAFENLVSWGHFLTSNGLTPKTRPSVVTRLHADYPLAQTDGVFAAASGSPAAYMLHAGSAYKAPGGTMITRLGSAEGEWDVWGSGFLDGACAPSLDLCDAKGKVSYLGGHEYSTAVPVSSSPSAQGVRLFLNALLDTPGISADLHPAITVVKSAPPTTPTPTATYTINISHTGGVVARGLVMTDPIPAGSTFVSATGGGVISNGAVRWNLGNLDSETTASVSFTVDLSAYGTYLNQAQLTYYTGVTAFSLNSNTTATLYGPGISASAGPGGAITPSGTLVVPVGSDLAFTVAPAPGYVIADVLVDGASVGAVASYLFEGVTANHTIAATFRGLPGAVPDGLGPGVPLQVAKDALDPGRLDLSWGDSCGAAQVDFAVYEGALGNWYSHAPRLCTTGGALTAEDLQPAAGDRYFLVVPLAPAAEGSYGTSSSGAEIPQGAGACLAAQDTTPCLP